MNYKDVDIANLRKSLITIIYHVTCFNCCKFYVNPTTAACGHSLCHKCWLAHRTCPSCAAQVDKKALKLNSPLQTKTQHVIRSQQQFQALYNINLDKTLDNEDQNHVREWLANSENHFSASVTNSQQFTEEKVKSIHQIVSDVQVHTKSLKMKEPERETIQMNILQDDWDEIKEMSETENNNDHETLVDPMDKDTFDFAMGDKDYHTCNPRRSTRNKESKSSNKITINVSPDKASEKMFNTNSDKKSNKLGQNWKNVNKMKKEFSKLNKKNNNKLNISIEMCNKAKSFTNIAASKAPHVTYNIDDNTPEIEDIATKNINSNTDNKINTNTPNDLPISANISNKSQITSAVAHIPSTNQKCYVGQNKTNSNILQINKYVNSSKVNFFKRGPFQILENSEKINEDAQVNFFKGNRLSGIDPRVTNAYPHIENKNTVRDETNDIQITIKIGNTLTNICIQKKDNDVKVNVNSDQAIQTSLSQCNNIENEPNAEQILNDIVAKEPNDVAACKSQHSTSKEQIEKSLSTKKNTTSADTSSANFEITESEEKEFEDQMETAIFINNQDKIEPQKLLKSDCTLKGKSQVQVLVNKMSTIPEDVEFLNDDIFDGESVKEGNVQPLESTSNTSSAILMPTVKSKSSFQKNNNKRRRDSDEHLLNNKKIKISQEIDDSNKKIKSPLKENIMDVESENINYDAIMSQVFANINADMENLRKTGTTTQISNTQKSNNKNFPQAITANTKQGNINKKTIEEINEKCSENVFSLLEEKDGNSEIFKTSSHKPLGPTPHVGDTSLVPGEMTDIDLAMGTEEKVAAQNMVEFVEFGTPIQDDNDDDKSIVEETPQKEKEKSSFLKSRNQNEVSTLPDDSVSAKCFLTTEKRKSLSKSASQRNDMGIEDVINISDSVHEITEIRKSYIETPLNITKFGTISSTHTSTPMAKKSLNFSSRNVYNDPEETLCPTSVEVAKTTQEREFMSKAFEQTLESSVQVMPGRSRRTTKLCIAGSCLTQVELALLKKLCVQRNWTFMDTYTNDLTHLVVGVDEEKKSQRSVKYMCALAGSKWIVSFAWVTKCLQAKDFVDEEPFEALDGTGEPGPKRSRLAKRKLFEGFSFYCLPPFTIIDIGTLKDILVASGGRVLNNPREVRATDVPAMLLAEPEHTQEDRFTYLAMELKIVPMNYEWVLDSLGTYTLKSIADLLLCPSTLLPPAVANWPPELILPCDD